jgi:peroxiredoxin
VGQFLVMKRFFAYLASLAVLLSLLVSAGEKEGHTIKVKVNGLKDTVCYFGYHFGEKQYISDTARVDSKGNVVFTGDKKLDGGIYLVVLPSKKYIEFIVSGEDGFSLETDTLEPVKNMKVKGSKENELFYDYLVFINAEQKKMEAIKKRMDAHKDNKDSAAFYKEKMQKVDEGVQQYKINFMKEHSETFVAKIFLTSQEPKLPPIPTLANGRKDSTFTYRFYRDNYLKDVDFSDRRLLRTPLLYNKIKVYMENLTYQVPDSITKSAKFIIDKAKADKEVFRYCVVYLTSTYEASKIMGMDGVFVALVEEYYKPDLAYWADSTMLFKVTDRARVMKPLLIGKKAPNLILADTSNQLRNLHAVTNPYTILCFWDPDCSHCKKTVPKLAEWYHLNKAQWNVEIFGVCTETEGEKWKKFIKDNNLDWINVADLQLRNNFRANYDISTTPILYLLDKDKKIFAKKIGVEQLTEILNAQKKNEERLKGMK